MDYRLESDLLKKLSDMTDQEIMDKYGDMARQIANTTGNITELTCPRDVKNPGLYFGAMLALKMLEEKKGK